MGVDLYGHVLVCTVPHPCIIATHIMGNVSLSISPYICILKMLHLILLLTISKCGLLRDQPKFIEAWDRCKLLSEFKKSYDPMVSWSKKKH